MPPRVSVIIATWNAADVLDRCLDSLRTQLISGGFETIVVDNASTDATAEVLHRHAGEITVIANERNEFYAGANNRAAAVARGDVLFFLNSDTELLDPDVLARLSTALEDPDIGLAGPMLLNPDGSLQPSCAAHQSLPRALVVMSGAHRLLPDRALARVAPDHWSHDRAADTGWVMGAALAVRASDFRRLGGFWATMYAEEQDLALRAQRLGLRVRFVPEARVMHVGNHSLAKRWTDEQRAVRVARAELVFLRAHYGRGRRAAIRAVVGGGYASRAIALRLLGRPDRAAVYRAMARTYAGPTPPRHG